MRLEFMTTAEILRTQSPETDLEKVLFSRIGDTVEEAEFAQQEVKESMSEFDDLTRAHEELIDEVAALMDDTDDAGLMDALTIIYKKWCT